MLEYETMENLYETHGLKVKRKNVRAFNNAIADIPGIYSKFMLNATRMLANGSSEWFQIQNSQN